METMQKLTTMDWVGENIRKKAQTARKEHWQMYFRYESTSEVESKFKGGRILSGLTTMKDDTELLKEHVWIVYG